jgi:hypothetical protein
MAKRNTRDIASDLVIKARKSYCLACLGDETGWQVSTIS